jgi:hypothetical protein
MKTEQPILITSIKCALNTGIEKHRFVGFDGNYGADGYKSLGVCNADTSVDEMIPVVAKGIAIVKTAGAISLGAAVKSFDDGLATAWDAGPVEGYAMDAASGSDELIRILLS